ncbi:hypothetical protein Bca101_060893 [Brassica carinata]
MDSATVGDDPVLPEIDTNMEIPKMMFAEGEEPVGVRVLTYQSSRAINTILDALEPEEIQFFRDSSFGKLIEIAEKPSFSGRFARFLLSRQLKVLKKHEAWFRFAGKPIRFSLREFAIVTGLPCGELPVRTNPKKKKNATEKPYWPELFGNIEDLSVSRTVKMLRRKTVTDKTMRIKLAALAFLSSVLLSTNLKMKMMKEHAQMLSDLNEFFAFPWGRLAFDMLMESIKKRDEVSLSQNTIALKGFALALQLVIVEAVPALTEVVQEAHSSSESDSDDEDEDPLRHRPRKHTLSPAHAREVDKRAEVVVRSIIPQDPLRPIEESRLVRSDEVSDPSVENLVSLIRNNFTFYKEMFRGGATQKDVEAMREKAKVPSKRKQMSRKVSGPEISDDDKLKSIVAAIIKPHIDRIDAKVSSALLTLHDVSATSAAIPSSVVATVEAMLQTFKEELGVAQPISKSRHTQGQHPEGDQAAKLTPPKRNTSRAGASATKKANTGDKNDDIISNILESLSEYSTPPRSARKRPESDGHSQRQLSPKALPMPTDTVGEQQPSLSINSQTGDADDIMPPTFYLGLTQEQRMQDPGVGGEEDGNGAARFTAGTVGEHQPSHSINSQTGDADDIMPPTFSLGLTQEQRMQDPCFGDEEEGNGAERFTEKEGEAQIGRKSKRVRVVPAALVNDYQCGGDILSRAWGGLMGGASRYESFVLQTKYTKLATLLKDTWVIPLTGLTVSSKDLVDIVEHSRLLPPRVLDILITLVRVTFDKHTSVNPEEAPHFLDTRFVSMFTRNYPKFKKCKVKETFDFTKGTINSFKNQQGKFPSANRFYFPFNLQREHWLGICVDCSAEKIFVLDCNHSLVTDTVLANEMKAISEMFPYLRKVSGCDNGVSGPFSVERVRGVSPNNNPGDSGISSVLLIQTHALFGPETCRYITQSVIPEESQRAAVMIYEFHQPL